ncbi:MAG: hypothetical protein HQK79_01140 [Desulfobacterales bacterium]|nr:hypothetical protein [Desulfobacterales bacterium]MBF0396621.1 hypothetical protein [Desulfobacterales bacterium]
MSKFNITGIFLWVGSITLLIFQILSSLMNREDFWGYLNLGKIIGNEYVNWINGISLFYIQKSLYAIISMPLFIILFLGGIALFLIDSMFNYK